MNREVAVTLMAILVLRAPLNPATIVVDDSCSLADAIAAANTDAPAGGCPAGDGVDTLELTESVTLTAPLPQLTEGILLEGNQFTVSRDEKAPDFRILDLRVDGSVAVRNVTITNGSSTASGGGIYNAATALTLTNVRLVGNAAADKGGGLMNGVPSEIVRLTNSTLADNQAGDDGGGIYEAFGTSIWISGSTLSGNSTSGRGGAVYQGYYSYLSLTNSTLSGNAAGTLGGGVYASWNSYATNVISSTLIGNTASDGGGIVVNLQAYGGTDGLIADSALAGNVGGNCKIDDLSRFYDLGGNFDDDGTCPGASPVAGGVDVDLRLANNGGPTLTHAVLPGSVLRNGGGPCGLEEDQRLLHRARICDSGAFQFGAAAAGGSVAGLLGREVTCVNVDTGQQVAFPLTDGAEIWNCEERGLRVSRGDVISQEAKGVVIDGAGGTVIGLAAGRVSCRNGTTGQSVSVDLATGPSWDCVDAGLTVSAGDRIRMVSRGHVP